MSSGLRFGLPALVAGVMMLAATGLDALAGAPIDPVPNPRPRPGYAPVATAPNPARAETAAVVRKSGKSGNALANINAYFNGVTSLEGNFQQTDSSNKRSNGRFYVLRPGKIRFDYAPPNPLRIIADGHSLAIEDKSLKTVEKYPIKSTPFRLLLAKNVDLGRDAKIVGVERDNNVLAITLEDRKGTAGHIKLSFDSGSQLELREWTITDAQGLTTRVTVDNLVRGRKKSSRFFKSNDAPSNPFQGMGG